MLEEWFPHCYCIVHYTTFLLQSLCPTYMVHLHQRSAYQFCWWCMPDHSQEHRHLTQRHSGKQPPISPDVFIRDDMQWYSLCSICFSSFFLRKHFQRKQVFGCSREDDDGACGGGGVAVGWLWLRGNVGNIYCPQNIFHFWKVRNIFAEIN